MSLLQRSADLRFGIFRQLIVSVQIAVINAILAAVSVFQVSLDALDDPRSQAAPGL